MKITLHTSLVITLICLGSSIQGMKRKKPNTNILTQANQFPESLYFPDEVIAPIAAYSEPKEKNVLMRVCKTFGACLKNGRDQVICINPWTVHPEDRKKAIFEAVRVGGAYPSGTRPDKYELVQRLLDTKSTCIYDMRNVLDMTPLHYVQNQNNNAMMQLLIDSLQHSRENEIAEYIKKTNKPLNQMDKLRPFFTADLTTIDKDLFTRTNAHIKESYDHYINQLKPNVDPLHEAVYEGNLDQVKELLALGTNPNLRIETVGLHEDDAEYELAPLGIAVHEGHATIVKFLLANGADVNQVSTQGTALNIAVEQGKTEVLKILVHTAGIDANYADLESDISAPLYAAVENGDTETVKCLLCADGIETVCEGWPVLCKAVEEGHLDIVKLLLCDHKTNVNALDPSFHSPLHFALPKDTSYPVKYPKIMKLLLCHPNLDLNCQEAPLAIAAKYGYTDIAKLLIDRGAQVNNEDQDGHTPLYNASKYGHIEIVKLLLANGANPNIIEYVFGSAIDIADQNGHSEIVSLFIKHRYDWVAYMLELL